MIVARMILVSAMLTVGIVETTRTAVPRLAGEAPAAAPAAVPAPVAPGPACAAAVWPYLPEPCLRPGAPGEAEPRRPVRVIEEQRPAAPVRIPGRVSVG
ncbi:hypothetical protein [Methylobacterium platani]|uniref:Uncharacterized protein n=2 Tax=Methylobacterium platani TaxID=427683 RepID=A0A179RYY0_9HYPH|nr:hypothetical protein [Methylobacterium platani]KMO17857.1 hypothetical protein SQ03_11475 [Methylobacterium platani JCM 14648]OAS15945.1 hypothetical protein A5481_28875 [Methylobacterium platani]